MRARDLGQRDRRDDAGAALRERALVEIGMPREQPHGDGLPEHRVAEELEALVVRALPVLVRPGSVGERQRQKLGVDVDSELLRKLGERGALSRDVGHVSP